MGVGWGGLGCEELGRERVGRCEACSLRVFECAEGVGGRESLSVNGMVLLLMVVTA